MLDQLILIYLISVMMWCVVFVLFDVICERIFKKYNAHDEYYVLDIAAMVIDMIYLSLIPIYRVFILCQMIKYVYKKLQQCKKGE